MVKPLVAGVVPLPFEAPLLGFGEAACGVDAIHCPVEIALLEVETGAFQRSVGSDAVQDLIEGLGDFGGRIEDMPVQRQQPVRPQHLRCLAGAEHRVDPMPGLSRDDGVEGSAARVPLLEFADLDLDPGLPGESGHPGVHVDAEHIDAGCPVLAGPDAGTAADVQEISTGAGGDDALYQLVGVGRPRPVVPLRVDSERLCYLPQLVRHLFDRHGFDVYTTKPRPCQGLWKSVTTRRPRCLSLTAKVRLPSDFSSRRVGSCTFGDEDGSWNHRSSEPMR